MAYLNLNRKESQCSCNSKQNMTLPTREFQFLVIFSHKSSIVLVCHVCSFTSSVCFRLRWLGLISSFYPLQSWWGPKCLLSDTAKGNPHKSQKALKKLRAKLGWCLLLRAASSPCAALPRVSMAALQREGEPQPIRSAPSPRLKGSAPSPRAPFPYLLDV